MIIDEETDQKSMAGIVTKPSVTSTKLQERKHYYTESLNPNNVYDILHPLQCVPLYTLLAAMGHPTVNWFILDIEGAEFQVRERRFYQRNN